MATFKYVGGMVGNPDIPNVAWSDEQMQILRDMGMNFAQMNIAWNGRPGNEPLNLEHLDDEMLATFRYRVDQLNKFGMKGMPHFGLPRMLASKHVGNITPYMTPACLLEEETTERNWAMMERLMKTCPEIDDYMFYTYDQHAWICSEFGGCPNCAGIPLDERLPAFINEFKRRMATLNPNVTFWWQPWELSLGQITEVLYKLEPGNIGLMVNTAGSESYFNNLDNYWIRGIGAIAAELNIPIIGEIQSAGSGVAGVPLQRVSCPSLVKRQIDIVRKLPTFVGIKEHYGYAFEKYSSNMIFLTEYLRDPDADTDTLLERTALHYGKKCVKELVEAWKISEVATDFIPFEFVYLYSNICGYSPKHNFDVPMVQGVHADTPAWESDRRAYFLITHDIQYHPWALENAALKFKQAGFRFKKMVGLLREALAKASDRKDDLKETIEDMYKVQQACLGQYYWFKESLAAYDARIAIFQRDSAKTERALARFDELMRGDIENQEGDEEIVKKYEEFKADYKKFFEDNFRQEEHLWATSYIEKIDQRY